MRRRATISPIALVIVLIVVIVVWFANQSGSPETPHSTPASPISATGTWYEIYFTDPKYPDNPANHHGGLDERLVAFIDRAQKTLDVADYDFDLQNVADAMVRAKNRGVRVRMVTDSDTLLNKDERVQAAFRTLRSAGIPIVDDRRPAIMHDKFTVMDGEWVETGSWNYTDGDTYHLNNWMGIFHSRELAENYTAEFQQMFSRKFGPDKSKTIAHPSIDVDGARVQNCFSPKGDCADLIVSTIDHDARRSIYFMAYSFTHDGIGKAIIDKAKAGVTVQGVFETTGSQTLFSEFGKMKKAGLDVYTDGNPWVMHHKVIIIDDHLVIAGSFNFSASANDENDENLLIIDDPSVARLFKAEFDRVFAVAKNPPAKKQSGDRREAG